ncbi:MAG: flavodoxin family protein [Clostridia bacterium]|jgi:multimeric flavodoxin WrbA
MSKIAILIGSPRKGGNTDMLVQAFIDGIDKQKNSFETISVADVRVNGCIGCNACYANSKCIQKDDMQDIYNKLTDAETIVIATPIYFYGISSQLKSIVDRLHNPIRGRFSVKRLVLLMVCADTIPTVFDSVVAMYQSILSYFSLQDGGIIRACGVKDKGDIAGNPVLNEAFELAKTI